MRRYSLPPLKIRMTHTKRSSVSNSLVCHRVHRNIHRSSNRFWLLLGVSEGFSGCHFGTCAWFVRSVEHTSSCAWMREYRGWWGASHRRNVTSLDLPEWVFSKMTMSMINLSTSHWRYRQMACCSASTAVIQAKLSPAASDQEEFVSFTP